MTIMYMLTTFEKSVNEQAHSNDLKALEISLSMKKKRLKEAQIAVNCDSNYLERLSCCRFADYVELLMELTYIPIKDLLKLQSHACQPRNYKSNNANYFPTFAVGSRLRFCWKILHGYIRSKRELLAVLLGVSLPVTGGSMGHVLFPYWLRRLAFYAIVLVYLPLLCGLMPFAGPVSFASLDILALAGKDFFIIHPTFAIGRRHSWSLDEVSAMLSDDGQPAGLTWVLFAVMIK
ncbi:hypothetical protein Tco_1013074 [Tanacetum coccineum]